MAIAIVAVFTTTVVLTGSNPGVSEADDHSTTNVVVKLQCQGKGPMSGKAEFDIINPGQFGGQYLLWCDQDNRTAHYSGMVLEPIGGLFVVYTLTVTGTATSDTKSGSGALPVTDRLRSGRNAVSFVAVGGAPSPPFQDPCDPDCPNSDRNAKDNFAEVDDRDILARLSAIPIETWNYKSQDPSVRHIGPMAQDFYAAFGVGEDDRHINTVDASGVALAAIQRLYQMVQEKDVQIAELEARLEVLEQASSVNSSPAEASLFGGLTIWLALGGLVLVTPGLVLGYRRIRR